jgi:hypothetical protein
MHIVIVPDILLAMEYISMVIKIIVTKEMLDLGQRIQRIMKNFLDGEIFKFIRWAGNIARICVLKHTYI